MTQNKIRQDMELDLIMVESPIFSECGRQKITTNTASKVIITYTYMHLHDLA